MDDRSARDSNLIQGGVGGLAGLLILHPLAMAFAGGAGATTGDVLASITGAFRPAMIPMTMVFTMTGVLLFLLSAAVRRGMGATGRLGGVVPAKRSSLRRMCMGCKAIPQLTAGDHEV